MGSTLDISHASSGCMRTRGKFRIYDLEWVGDKVERFTGTFTQHCDERPEALTGCLHFENPFLRQADADLSHAASTASATLPPVPLPAPVGPASPPSHEAYRAHDPTPCLGGGNALFVDAGPGDPLVVGQQLVSRQPFNANFGSGMVGLRIETVVPGQRGWTFGFGSGKKPLSTGLYTMILGDRRSTGDVSVSVGYSGCQIGVARFRVHELLEQAGKPQRATVTFEIQCERSENEVLRGCVHFEN
jgi:hypothetical protein